MKFNQRPVICELEKEMATKSIIVVTGMRQVGKTTILNHLYEGVLTKNKVFLDFENPLHRKIFEEKNYDNIWNNLARSSVRNDALSYIFIDEVQNFPGVSSQIKYLHDHWPVKFVLTGSSSFYLKNIFPESMAGRKIIYEVFPLTFSEFLVFKGQAANKPKDFKKIAENNNEVVYQQLIGLYREYLEFGGFPGVVLEANPAKKQKILGEIFKSYFEKEVKNLADFREIAKARDLLLLLAARVGSKIDIAKLSSELSLSWKTVDNYLTFFEQTYFISLLPRHSRSIDRIVAGQRKLYFCDTGMASYLGKLSEGAIFEQSVFQNLRVNHQLSYFEKETQTEIDFVADGKTAIEAKLLPSKRDMNTLNSRAKLAGLNEAFCCSFSFSSLPQTFCATGF